MALHMADNGYYGIKIHPKKTGDEIVVENLKAVLAQYGDVKLFQHPNKYLAFAYYEHHEEARTCLNNMRISPEYAASPGWPKQTTADEKFKSSFKPLIKEDNKDTKEVPKDISETKINSEIKPTDTSKEQIKDDVENIADKKSSSEDQKMKIISKDENLNDGNATDKKSLAGDQIKKMLKKPLVSKLLEDDIENTSDKKTSSEDQKKKIISKVENKCNSNNDKLNENKPEKNENNKLKENAKNNKNESKFSKQLKQIINEVNAINLEKAKLKDNELKEKKNNWSARNAVRARLSRSLCRKDTYLNADNRRAVKDKRNRHYSANRANNRCSRKPTKNNNFKNQSQKAKFLNDYDNTTSSQTKTKETALEQIDQSQSKPSTVPVQCCLVPAMDVWIAESIKYHKSSKLASYVAILNLPIVINAGIIYDLCKSFVPVLNIDIKYPDSIYLPPHAFVYTKTKEDANLLKSVLDGKRLKNKLLLVKTEEELENS